MSEKSIIRIRWAFLVLILLVLVAFFAALPSVIERLIVTALKDAGLDDVVVVVDEAGWSRVTLRDVRVGENLRIDVIDLPYTPTEIFEGGLGPLVISGLRLRGRVDSGGVSFGALDRLRDRLAGGTDGPSSAGEGRSDSFPPISVEVRDAYLELLTPVGAATTEFSGTVDVSSGGSLAAKADFTLRSEIADVDGSVVANIDSDGGSQGTVKFATGSVRGDAAVGARVESLAGGLELSAGSAGPINFRAALHLAGGLDLPIGNLAPMDDNGDGDSEGAEDLISIELFATLDDLSDAKAPLALNGVVRTESPVRWRGHDATEVVVDFAEARVESAARLDQILALTDAGGLLAAFEMWPVEVALSFGCDGLDIANVVEGASGDGRIRMFLADGALRIAAEDGFRFRATPLDGIAASLAGFTVGGVSPLANPWEISIHPREDFLLTTNGETISAVASIAAEFALDGKARARSEIEAEAIISAEGEARAVVLRKGRLIAPEISYNEGAISVNSLSLDLAAQNLGSSRGSLSLELGADSASLNEATLRGVSAHLDGHDITASADRGSFVVDVKVETASHGELTLQGGNLSAAIDAELGEHRLTARAGGETAFRLNRLALAGGGGFDDLELRLISGAGPLVDADFGENGEVTYHTEWAMPATVAALHLGDGETALLSVSIPALSLAGVLPWPDGEHRGQLSASGGEALMLDQGLVAAGIGTRITLSPGRRVESQITVAEIRQTQDPPAFSPLSLDSYLAMDDNGVAFDGRVSGAESRVAIEFAGHHDLRDRSGRVGVSLPPLRFLPGEFSVDEVSPALASHITSLAGEVSLNGEVSWTSDGVSGAFDVNVNDVSLLVQETAIEGIDGNIRINSLSPPGTPPGQIIKVESIDAGTPLENVAMTFQLRPGPLLFVESVAGQWAGGTLGATNLAFDVEGQGLRGNLQLADVDIEALANVAKIQGLAGTGKISGDVPVAFENGEFTISSGYLAAGPAGGVLRYRPDAVPSALAGGHEQVTLVMKALENFQYETLRADINLSTNAESAVRVHLLGSNPDVYEGRPIEFNLNLTGGLGQILQQGLRGYQFLNDMLDRL